MLGRRSRPCATPALPGRRARTACCEKKVKLFAPQYLQYRTGSRPRLNRPNAAAPGRPGHARTAQSLSPSPLRSRARSGIVSTKESRIRAGKVGHLPAPPEKRFLINLVIMGTTDKSVGYGLIRSALREGGRVAGLTLTELIIVTLVMGLLAAIVTPSHRFRKGAVHPRKQPGSAERRAAFGGRDPHVPQGNPFPSLPGRWGVQRSPCRRCCYMQARRCRTSVPLLLHMTILVSFLQSARRMLRIMSISFPSLQVEYPRYE